MTGHKDYCPFCRRVTPHIAELHVKLCKRCGRKDRPTLGFIPKVKGNKYIRRVVDYYT